MKRQTNNTLWKYSRVSAYRVNTSKKEKNLAMTWSKIENVFEKVIIAVFMVGTAYGFAMGPNITDFKKDVKIEQEAPKKCK